MGLFHVLGYQLSGEWVRGCGGGWVSLTSSNFTSSILQKFVGHSETISQLLVSPDSRRVISCGEALFVWEILSGRSFSPLPQSQPALLPKSASPRRKAPVPTSYEPVDAHSFTPMVSKKPETTNNGISSSSDEEGSAKDNRDGENNGRGVSPSEGFAFGTEMQNSPSRGSDKENSSVTSDEIIIDHTPQGGVELTVKSHSQEPSSKVFPAPAIPRAQKHYKYIPPMFSKPSELYVALPDHAGMRLRTVIGCSGGGRNNIVWVATTGKFVKAEDRSLSKWVWVCVCVCV